MQRGGGSKSPPSWDRILSAAQKNNASEIKRLVNDEDVSPSHSNAVGQSALHIAALWGHVEALKALLSLSAEINVHNRITGATPLHCAVQSSKQPSLNRVTCAEILLQNGADPELGDFYGTIPLEYLDENDGDDKYVKLMREALNSFVPEKELFEIIGKRYDLNEVAAFFSRKDVDVRSSLEDCDTKTGLTPLLFSIDKLIIMCEARDQGDIPEGELPSHTGEETTLLKIIDFLLEKGANPNVVPKKRGGAGQSGYVMEVATGGVEDTNDVDEKQTPLYKSVTALSSAYLSSHGSTEEETSTCFLLEKLVLALMRHGSTVSTSVAMLVHDAARRNNILTVTFLIEKLGVNPNIKGRQGLTPLHFAARSGRIDIVNWLVSFKPANEEENVEVDIDIMDDRGKTALDAAIVNEKHEIVHILEKIGKKSHSPKNITS